MNETYNSEFKAEASNPIFSNEVTNPNVTADIKGIISTGADKEILETLSSIAEENEDIKHLRDIQESSDEQGELVESKQTFMVRENGKPDFTKALDENGELPSTDLPIDELESLDDANTDKMVDNFKETASAFDLTNEEAENIAKILVLYKNNKRMNVYAEMIPSMKARINKLCFESSIPITEANTVAKYMIDQFLTTASTDQEFVDIEKSLEEAMKIPSLIDIYTEHVSETMNIRLPAMAAEIRKTDPEKADLLMKVCDQYNNAFLFSKLREMYDTKAPLRKAVRKKYQLDEIKKRAANVNYFNDKTQFKMPDCTPLLGVLSNIFEKDKDIWPADVMKFITLLLESISYLNLDELLDASYAYYLLKNISMLSYLGDKLSDFSAELISNIKITMFYIRIREDEVYGNLELQQQHKSNGKKRK